MTIIGLGSDKNVIVGFVSKITFALLTIVFVCSLVIFLIFLEKDQTDIIDMRIRVVDGYIHVGHVSSAPDSTKWVTS